MRIFAKIAAAVAGLFIATAAAQAAVSVRIDLSSQRMHVTSGSGESYTWAISSGKSGFGTPRGSYRPYSLQRMHYSRKYDNAPMPYSIFFRGGYAIHGTGAVGMLGRPASHGCVRLSTGNAARLFAMVQREGASISISGAPAQQTIAKKSGKKTYVASKKGKKTYLAAKHGKKKPTAVAAKRGKANPLAYAPSQRRSAPSVQQFQQNPTGY
jgi:hypothetical protein